MQSRKSSLTLLMMLLFLAACVPIPLQIYTPEASPESLAYSSCRFNTHVPVGVVKRVGPATVTISLLEHAGRNFVQVHIEVPSGTVLQLADDSIAVVTNVVTAVATDAARFKFPSVSLVDTPIVNSYSSLAVLQDQQLPSTAPLVGSDVRAGANTSGRHFWLATYVETKSAEKVFITLPIVKLNSVAQVLPTIEFTKKTMAAVALINC